ncbi:hypothetical protein C8R43DRAFT_1122728 [Mycena crocata]|nr:hypothetical protein C8R43DRAFT_1122728 [Mycena crocata]
MATALEFTGSAANPMEVDESGRLLHIGGDRAEDPCVVDAEGRVILKGASTENTLALPASPTAPRDGEASRVDDIEIEEAEETHAGLMQAAEAARERLRARTRDGQARERHFEQLRRQLEERSRQDATARNDALMRLWATPEEIERPVIQHSIWRVGAHVRERGQPRLTPEALYLTAERPPAKLEPAAPHHQCRICWGVKSHAVTAGCGHSYCYVCIRVHLERNFKCPLCSQVMYRPPFRHTSEDDWLEATYPRRLEQG